MTRAPLLPAVTGFLLGLWLGAGLPYFPLTLIALFLLTAGIVLRRWPRHRLLLLGIPVGALYFLWQTLPVADHHLSHFLTEEAALLEGVIDRPPSHRPDRVVLTLTVRRIESNGYLQPASGRVRITVQAPEVNAGYGDVVRLEAKLHPPRGFRNFRAFDFEAYLAQKGIAAAGSVREHEAMEVLAQEGNLFLRAVFAWRERIRQGIAGSLSGPPAALLQALAVGEDGAVTEEMREAFMRAGVTHILSVSGSHLGLLLIFCFAAVRWGIRLLPSRVILRLTLRVNPNKLAGLLAIPPVAFYALLAGGEVPAIRSLVMILLVLAALLLDREEDLLNSLALAALLILLWDPQAIFDISFQLSFLSVFAIGVAFLRWKQLREDPFAERPEQTRWARLRETGFLYLLMTVAAGAGTAPLVAYYFNQCSLIGVLANLLIVPYVGFLVLPVGLASSLGILWTGGTLPLAEINALLLNGFYGLTRLFAAVPYGSFTLPAPSPAVLVLFYLLFAALLAWQKKQSARWMGTAADLGLLALILLAYLPTRSFTVSFLDVGQGDGMILELPNRQVAVLDGGGSFPVRTAPARPVGGGGENRFDPGKMAMAPALRNRGIRRIDYLVLSHPHPDHAGGLRHLLREFPVGEIWINGDPYPGPAYQEFLTLATERKISVRIVEWQREPLEIGGAWIHLLHPFPEFVPGSKRGAFSDENSRSLVLKVTYGERSFLLPGDVEEEGEVELTAFGPLLKSDLLKVPHHGGRTSSTWTFLERVRPEAAVVQVGARNRFGHPHTETLDRYAALGIPLYRTDLDGEVRVTTDGRDLRIVTFAGSRLTPLLAWPLQPWPLAQELENLRKAWHRFVGEW
ncbi:MAG: DNA internalization-related competence protein ComEC/Rec2 [Nitrospirae bacterium]|nr:DNA internalization-related competence protein ComEC/Rec2 [Nitrospirota bacterium]